eukprot:gene24556-29871_t
MVAVNSSFEYPSSGVEWMQSHGVVSNLGLTKKEFGHLSKNKKLYKNTKYHHMVALAMLANGGVLAIWQAAQSSEGLADQHLRLTVSTDRGMSFPNSWSLNISHQGPLWNPVPHVDASGRLWVFYAESEGDCVRNPRGAHPRWPPGGSIKELAEGSHTSGVGCSVYDGAFIPKLVANKLVVLSSGEWVIPYWRDNIQASLLNWGESQQHCRAKDGGSTWEPRGDLKNAIVPGSEDAWGVGIRTTWLIGNSVVELRDGHLL